MATGWFWAEQPGRVSEFSYVQRRDRVADVRTTRWAYRGHCEPIIEGCRADKMRHSVPVKANTGLCEELRRMSGLTETSPGMGIRSRHKQLEQELEHCVSSPLLWRPEKAQTAVSVPAGPRHLATYPVPIHGLSKVIKPPPTRCSYGSTMGKEHAPEKTAVTAQGMAGRLETARWQQLADWKGLSPPHYPAGLMGWETKERRIQSGKWTRQMFFAHLGGSWVQFQSGHRRVLRGIWPALTFPTQWVCLPAASPCNISLAGS